MQAEQRGSAKAAAEQSGQAPSRVSRVTRSNRNNINPESASANVCAEPPLTASKLHMPTPCGHCLAQTRIQTLCVFRARHSD
eukprot:6208606-Pleurochrysis_carterae.AAC.2